MSSTLNERVESIAKEIGARCRRVRTARNMSQAALAEALFTTSQNISKMEKEGISNIDMIRKISSVLGYDLLNDESDEEGAVGEVGMEILRILLTEDGRLNTDSIDEYLFGMNEKRVTNEIFKLEQIGMCVREKYIEIDGEEHDTLFITAKGVITYKNHAASINGLADFSGKIDPEYVYEKIIGDYASYQEKLDAQPILGLIWQLEEDGGRGDFIYYLKNRHHSLFTKAENDSLDLQKGRSFYVDVLYRMIMGADNETIKKASDDWFCMPEIDLDELWFSMNPKDDAEIVADMCFQVSFPSMEEKRIEVSGGNYLLAELKHELEKVNDPSINEKMNQFSIDFAEIDHPNENHERLMNPDDRYLEMYQEKGTPLPSEWFSADEIRKFIETNYKTCINHSNEDKLREIYENDKYVLRYYEVPDSWKQNGLMDLMKEVFNLPDYDYTTSVLYKVLNDEKLSGPGYNSLMDNCWCDRDLISKLPVSKSPVSKSLAISDLIAEYQNK